MSISRQCTIEVMDGEDGSDAFKITSAITRKARRPGGACCNANRRAGSTL
ncbi:MAG TPA: hypothetical protein VMF65_02885 [Acidimicrobiales bacterium]|nr:hypothetical protein [Acidimicrobiales bacterium]